VDTGHAQPDEAQLLRIREIAMHLFAERGFAETTTADVAEAAGVDPALVREHFPVKAAFIRFGFDRIQHLLVETLAQYQGTGKVADGVRAAMRAVLTFDVQDHEHLAARMEMIHRESELFPETEDRTAAHVGTIIAFVAAELGKDPDDLEPRLIGETMNTAARVATRHWITGNPSVSLAEAVDVVIAPVLDAYLAALTVP
jgi:AcrR family transcriptional regulator